MVICILLLVGIVLWHFVKKYRRSQGLLNLQHKNILITGGANGLGQHLARKLLPLAKNVILLDIDNLSLQRLYRETKIRGYVCDVSVKEEVDAKASQIQKEIGPIHILINNAAIKDTKSILKLSPQEINKVFGVNILSHYWTTQAFLPGMLKMEDGHIVSICSVLGLSGVPYLSVYSSSKSAVSGFHEALRRELQLLKAKGISTSIIYPAKINTPLFKDIKQNPLVPELSPEDVANEILDCLLLKTDTKFLPWFLQLVPLLKVLPTAVEDWLLLKLGVTDAAKRAYYKT
uniref:Short-chain dehydrogenase/reductase 3 n=1 Tax=Arcella intermedia TaxID=1963864 RepID=A0A6B2LCQ4_9EUKA